MLRRRILTLDITTNQGRPEDWHWPGIIFPGLALADNTVKVVGVIEEEVE